MLKIHKTSRWVSLLESLDRHAILITVSFALGFMLAMALFASSLEYILNLFQGALIL